MLNEEEKQAIERLSSINENTEEYDGNLFKEDFNIILNLIEKQQNTMYKMASFLASQDIECDICEKTGRLDECDSMAYGECENCIINYFKNSGENF